MSLDPAIDLALRCAYGVLFATALAHKLLRFTEFRATLAAYLRGWPEGIQRHVGPAVAITAEALAVTTCIAPAPRALRAAAIAGLLLVYAAAMGMNLLRGNALLDCGCHWSRERQPVTSALVWRNIVMALPALALALPQTARYIAGIDVATALASTALVALLYAAATRLAGMPAAAPASRGLT